MRRFVAMLKRNKTFYIALFVCAMVIAATGYTATKINEHPENEYEVVNQPVDLSQDATQVAAKPTPTSSPLPTSAPSQKPAAPTAKPTQAPSPAPIYTFPVPDGSIVTPHSPSALLYSKTFDDWRTHSGIDIAAEKGTQVKSISDGTVEKVWEDPSMGNSIQIRSGDYLFLYQNLSTLSMVKEGQAVKSGDIISGVGDSALDEIGQQPHLHLEILKGELAIDPNALIS